VPYSNNSIVTQSFPLGMVTVQFTPPPAPPPTAPPPPPAVPPPFAIASPATVAVGQPVGVGNSVGVASVSLQAAAAGFLAAGFLRVSMKNKPIALRVAAKSGSMTSKFDKEASASKDSGVGRFE
jgi:hypothetical protein